MAREEDRNHADVLIDETPGLGQGGARGSGGGGLNADQDALRAQAEAQERTDATDAEDLLDKTRASQDVGSINDNESL